MKGMKLALGLMMASVLMLTSCSKDSDGNITTKMSATIGSSNWNSTIRETILFSNVFTISGTSFSGEALVITVKGSSPGTYNLEFDLANGAAQCGCIYTTSALSGSKIYTSTEGTVKLTEVDKSNKTISGSFSFKVYNFPSGTLSVKNGTFSKLSYTEQSLE